ncbi:hypothetical protein cypCar_00014070 [Cyprinus carpio]|nr:hypothetical protein cypCar_00014070 [Cyprinus carpio]
MLFLLKERMISMTLDKDHEVAIQAMRLLMVISQSCEDVLSPDEHKNVFQFVYCTHRPLSTTIGLHSLSFYKTHPICVAHVINTKEKKLQIDDCTKLTEHFIKVLPELSSKCVQALLAELEAAVDRHTDAGLLETAARSYQSLCAQDSPWHSLAQPSFEQLIQHWTDTLGTRLGESQSVTVEALRFMCNCILWKLNIFGEGVTSRESALQQRSQLRAVCEKCHRCLSHAEQLVREQVSITFLSLFTAYHLIQPFLQMSESECGDGRLEDLHRRRNLLVAYCKLIVHSVLEMSMAAEVFKQYVKYYSDFGDIIKETLNRTRQMDKIESARTLVQCLQQLYLRLKQEQDRGNACSSRVQTYSSIKELARRFSLTFGWDQIKSHESLAMIHRDGIEFVFKGFIQQSEKHSPPYIHTSPSSVNSPANCSNRTRRPCHQQQRGELDAADVLMGTAEGEDAFSFISSLTNCSRSPSVKQVNSEGDQRFLSPCSEPKGNKLLKSSEDSKVQQAPLSKEQLTSSLVSAKGPRSSAEVDVDIVDIDV